MPRLAAGARPWHVPVIWSRTGFKPTWSCRPGVTVFLAEVINLKPCSSTCTCSQARGHCGGASAVLWSQTGWKPNLELVSRCSCFGAAAIWRSSGRCQLWATDCRRLEPAEAGPCEGHINNLPVCFGIFLPPPFAAQHQLFKFKNYIFTIVFFLSTIFTLFSTPP